MRTDTLGAEKSREGKRGQERHRGLEGEENAIYGKH